MRIQKILPLLFLFLAASPAALAGVEISAQGAGAFNSSNYGFASSPSLLLGAQLTMGLTDLFQLGVAFQHNSLSYQNNGGTGQLNFLGALVRIGTMSPIFFDGQAGIADRDNIGNSFSYGVGAGFKIPVAYLFDLSPRVGYRSVPDSGVERSQVDVGLLFTLTIL
jgi:hypothetical protein